MGYYHIKNIDIDKKNETITAEFADSNTFPTTYWKSEIKGNTFHEKYSYLIYDIITGNYHPTSSSKYNVLCNTWAEPALANFTGDCNILGVERAYDKYKNVIEAILQKKEPEIIKSEIELHYKLDYGKNKDYSALKIKIRNLCDFMGEIRRNEKLSKTDKLEIYREYIKQNEISFPLLTLTGYEHSTKMYLNPNLSNDGYVSYKVTVENTETGILKDFKSENMSITWFTDYDESEMTYKIQSYERDFLVYQKCRDFLNEKIYTEIPQKETINISLLGIKENEIRTFLDILNGDDRSKNYKYDNKTKEIKFNYDIEKESQEVDIADEMYG